MSRITVVVNFNEEYHCIAKLKKEDVAINNLRRFCNHIIDNNPLLQDCYNKYYNMNDRMMVMYHSLYKINIYKIKDHYDNFFDHMKSFDDHVFDNIKICCYEFNGSV
jgi:hypothetical protein